MSGLTNSALVEGILANNMGEDGLIRIPIKKDQTGFLSQIYANAESSEDTATKAKAGGVQKLMVKEPLTNSQNLSYIGEL